MLYGFCIALIRLWVVFYIYKLIDLTGEFLEIPDIFKFIIFLD
jgi:hypothetical protein